MKRKTNNFWLGVFLITILLASFEGTLIRIASNDLSVPMLMALRYVIAAIFALPFAIIALKKHQVTIKRLLFLMLVSAPLIVDPLIWQYVVATTNASFAAILSLTAPITFMIISTIATRDRISSKMIVGFLSAVFGGFIMVLLPNLNSSAALNFGAIPVILMLIQGIVVSVLLIIFRKEHERGTPMVAILAPVYSTWAIISVAMAFLSGDMGQIHSLTTSNWLVGIYLGIVASILMNAVSTQYYERAGTTASATMKYFKKFLTILIPILVLGEMLSWEIALGAAFIIIGVIITSRKHKNKKLPYSR
ncbi:DMT family transporter [Candidatus Saccharibacteria bacterium]|nr:DMT family transporter [Candidatus Saccharibacteria bacterium]